MLRALDRASGQVRAVFSLRDPEKSAVGDTISTLLERAAERSGARARDLAVYENLGVFALQASVAFIRELLREKEISSAAQESSHESALIPPKNVRRAAPGRGEVPRKKRR